jgi:hypothetical protein
MSVTYKATIQADEGKKVIIEIEDPNSAEQSEVGAESGLTSSDGSFSFTDQNGKRLTITIAE